METSTSEPASLQANPGKSLTCKVGGVTYARYPIRTKLVTSGDKIVDVVKDAVGDQLRPRDTVVISEKVVAISQGRAFPVKDIQPGWWARTLSKRVTKSPYGIGLGIPETMQLAIDEAGLPRMLFAIAISVPARIFGVRGLFYHLAGNNINAIDGPTEGTIPPYDTYAKLPPKDPERVARRISKALGGTAVAIIDANDIGQRILGSSEGADRKLVAACFRDNPLGQGAEQTPVSIIRRVS
jgi:F420-0:gamma-glutamyl ligase-like protein